MVNSIQEDGAVASTISISPVTEISIEYEPSWPWARFFWLANTFNKTETAFDFNGYNVSGPYVSSRW